MKDKKIKILIAKPGLDGHEAGAKLVAHALADANMEVIYTGPRQTPEMIVDKALSNGVDMVGLSILSGAHLELCSKIVELFKAKGKPNIPIILGGIIPENDIPELKKLGILEIFGPGTATNEIATFIQKHFKLKTT